MAAFWGLRLSVYLIWRNRGKGRISGTGSFERTLGKNDIGGSVTFRFSFCRDINVVDFGPLVGRPAL